MKFKLYFAAVSMLMMSFYAKAQDEITSDVISNSENGLTGYSSDVSGGWAIVSSPQKDVNNITCVGSATIFQLTNSEWKIRQELLPTNLGSFATYGSKVALDKTIAVISAPGDHETALFSGAVYVYEYDYPEDTWLLTNKLKASDAALGKRFGHSVDSKDGIIAVGAFNADGAAEKSGAAYVFEKANGSWTQKAKLMAGDGISNDFFGHQIHVVDANTIAVGAYNADGAAERSGVVYVFERIGDTWSQTAKLFNASGESADMFGYSLASGPTRNSNGIGTLDNQIIFVGAPGTNNENGHQTGAVYFYLKGENGWHLSYTLLEEEGEHNDHFGVSLSCNENGHLFVGANRKNITESLNTGKVFFYDTYDGEGVSVSSGFDVAASSISSYDHYGTSVSSDNENVIVGSPYADPNDISNAGRVHFFRLTTVVNEELEETDLYNLGQNSPNPSTDATVIEYTIKKSGYVKLSLYNLNGQLINTLVDEQKGFGVYRYNLTTRNLKQGVYLYKLEINGFEDAKKLVVGK